MHEPSLTTREQTLLRDLTELLAMRAERHGALTESRDRATADADRRLRAATEQADAARAAAEAAAAERAEADRAALDQRLSADARQAEAQLQRQALTLKERAANDEAALRKKLQDAVWLAESVYDTAKDKPRAEFDARKKDVDAHLAAASLAEKDAAQWLADHRQRPLPAPAAVNAEPGPESPARLADAAARLKQAVADLDGIGAARLFGGANIILPPIAGAIVGVAAAAGLRAWTFDTVAWIAGACGAGLGVAGMLWLLGSTRTRTAAAATALAGALADVRAQAEAALAHAKLVRQQAEASNKAKRDEEIARAKRDTQASLDTLRQRIEQERARIEREQHNATARHGRDGQDAAARIDVALREAVGAAGAAHERALTDARAEHRATVDRAAAEFDAAWTAVRDAWGSTMRRAAEQFEAVRAAVEPFKPWGDPSWAEFSPPSAAPAAVPIGSVRVDLSALPGGLPAPGDGLALSLPARFDLPVALQFPQRASQLIQAGPDGRAAGVAALQQTVLRLLTSFPAGKVRFTLIDPVGLGQSFAGFMHLSDYEQAIVGDKIWTEPRHIEQKLTDLTEHMEDVIQKYLRNEYESIDAYNAQAGEVAEPYRFLVLADFPTNLTDQAAKRLASIIASGPRCGVYTLILADARHKPPPGLHMADLEKAAGVRLVYRAGRFVREDGGFNGLELSLDAPPPEQAFTDLIHRLGESLKDSTRVQVPFATVAPGPGEQWSLASDRDVTVPIGRAGATKLQHLTLGKGTAQHALIAGRTGSGKSTLLHAIITSAALWYAPGQVELYLVDFKKGVEFKTYVTHALPHARVIAIESEREFGLSVLRRLDAELKRRGNLYRDLNVQDLAGFRQASPGTPMPRVLLIVDEFQELFVEDDKIAQEATLLLDRLVRQGRAFGMHVVLGSQTLGGAYSLARSTIGQMAVRIALQCSEADAYLIMSDDNSAPRLLSRPGEAIYNDASGAVEGNSPFQVVWLPDEQRDDFLGRVRAEARARPAPAEPPIVFEGNVPADVSRLAPLAALLEAPAPPEAAPAAPRLWLGEPVSIKEATASVFRRQSGTNTLIVGQKDESALAMIAVGMIGLAAQEPPSPPGAAEMLCPRFVVLDGTPADEPGAGLLASIGAWLPQGALCPEYREATDAVARVHAELQRRKAADTGAAPARALGLYLFIHGLQRFRALRKKEDEFGFSDAGDAAAPAPDRMFAEILSDGPALGVHTVAWCDTVTNLDRTLSRQSLREFDVRVLFQMSPTDSSALIDGPAAGLIGQNRALFHSEEQGVLEKFRPWAVPSEAWLARARHALSARTAGV